MPSPGRNPKAQLIRLAVIVVLGGAALLFVKLRGSPLALGEDEVRRIVEGHELNGLTLDEAARKLQHAATPTTDGMVVLEFSHIRGWTGGSVVLDVRGGKVVAATLQRQTFDGKED